MSLRARRSATQVRCTTKSGAHHAHVGWGVVTLKACARLKRKGESGSRILDLKSRAVAAFSS